MNNNRSLKNLKRQNDDLDKALLKLVEKINKKEVVNKSSLIKKNKKNGKNK